MSDNTSEFIISSIRWLKNGLLLPIIILNGWALVQFFNYFEPFITIFVAASLLAFILNYPVEFLQQHKIARGYAVGMVLLLSLVGLGALAITLLPAILEQVSAIVTHLPNWLDAASERLQLVQQWAVAHGLPINLNRLIREVTDRIPERVEGLGDETVLLTLNLVGGLSSILLTVVLTLYLLLDGKRIWNTFFRLLPLAQRQRQQVRRALQEDFHHYFVGQATLGLILGSLLSIVFLVLRVPYSLLLGSVVGVLTLVPFADVVGYWLICLLLAAQSPGLAFTVLIIATVLDQLIDQIVAPRIMGSFTGLKPIWVIISLLVGTKLFGVAGLLVAVPIASFIHSVLNGEEESLDQVPILPDSASEHDDPNPLEKKVGTVSHPLKPLSQ